MRSLLIILLISASARAQSVFMINVAQTSSGTAQFKAITIDHTKVPSDQTDFPFSFTWTAPFLKSVGQGGGVVNPHAYDITFSSDSTGLNLLKWETVFWDSVAGKIYVVIRTNISSSSNTVIYLRYGNASLTTFQGGNAGAVWDAGTAGVWHFDETITAAAQPIKDWTSHGNDMTTVGTWTSAQQVAGQVGGALKYLNANGDYSTFASAINDSTNYTIMGWFYVPTGSDLTDGNTYALGSTDGNGFWGWDAGAFDFSTNAGDDLSTVAWTSNSWVHIAVTVTSVGTVTIYQNGVAQTPIAHGFTIRFNSDNIGRYFTQITQDMICDELETYSDVRSNDRIVTIYNNQHSPNTFYSVQP